MFASEVDAAGEDRVLELVGALRELGCDDPALARLAKAERALRVAVLATLDGSRERSMLGAAEEIGEPGDDRRLLARLLLADPNGSGLLGALVEVAGELGLELVRGQYIGQCSSVQLAFHSPIRSSNASSRRHLGFTFTRRSR